MFGLKLNSNFHPLEVVGRGSETQFQIDKNLKYLIYRFRVDTNIQGIGVVEIIECDWFNLMMHQHTHLHVANYTYFWKWYVIWEVNVIWEEEHMACTTNRLSKV